MAKRKSNSTKYTSKSERKNVAQQVQNAMRRDYMQSADRILNQLKAHMAGKKVMLTIENPNKNQTNKRLIKVPSTDIWKKPSK